MKVLFISKSNLDSGYGTENSILRQGLNLAKNHSLQIITSNRGNRNTDFISRIRKQNGKVYEINILKRPPFYSPKGLIKLFFSIKEADVVYIWEPPTLLNPLIAAFSIMLRRKVVRGRHNPFFYEVDLSGKVPKYRRIIRMYEKMNLFFDMFYSYQHVQNSKQYDFLKKLGFRNVMRLPACIDTKTYKMNEKYDNFSILFLGRLNFHKGADRIPDIVEKITKEIPGCTISILGDGIFKNDLSKKLAKFGNVTMEGYVDNSQKLERLSRSHVLVSPTRIEAFMLTGVEALASGTPVVSFDVPGPSDYIENGVNGYICHSAEECVQSVFKIHDKWLQGNYGSMAQSALDSSRKYDCEIITKEFENLLAGVVKEKI